ncbi:MAG: dihydropteroate synthase [Chloroflexi bacterium]|nr:dihydropteroate synthase [Chloroflexota bacterium]
MITRVSSLTRETLIGEGQPTVLIGERLNPAGKKGLTHALRSGNLEAVRKEAEAQARAGADILDISVSTFGVEEESLLPQVVKTVMAAVDTPLCLDSHNPAALEAALQVYKGKALINSVTGAEQSLARILPLVKAFGAGVVGLTQDDHGISADADRRLAVAHHIVERAAALGIPREDIVIDCLVLAVGADAKAGLATLEAIRKVRAELGVNVTLGASNISFGLPGRDVLNGAFVAMAIAAGATSLIVDVAKVLPAVLAADLLLGRDQRARRYIDAFRQHPRL